MTDSFIPYGRQSIDRTDIDAVVEVMQSEWLTTGPVVERFEQALADFVGTEHAVAVSSGTAALHASMFACGIGPGDEVIVPPLTFVATANAVVYQGGSPVFVDVQEGSLLLDPDLVEKKVTSKTRAVIAVDYAGQPCDYQKLRAICDRHGLFLIADSCHSLGGCFQGKPCGTLADLTAFSFHPVKPLTSGEGGMVVTGNADFAERARRFRNHGITTDHRQRQEQATWHYEMIDLGFNYRLTDIHSALGLSQLGKLERWLAQRRNIVKLYEKYLEPIGQVRLLKQHSNRQSGWHLLVIRVAGGRRDDLFQQLRTEGIGANVHYGLVYRHPFYRNSFQIPEGTCPIAEQAEREILSLPLFPDLQEEDVRRVCMTIRNFFSEAWENGAQR